MPRVSRRFDHCPFDAATQTLKVLGGRWKLLIVKLLLDVEELRYSQLRQRLPGVSEKMLSQVLHELNEDGLLQREERKVKEPKIVYYQLTPLGKSAAPLVKEMIQFGCNFQ